MRPSTEPRPYISPRWLPFKCAISLACSSSGEGSLATPSDDLIVAEAGRATASDAPQDTEVDPNVSDVAVSADTSLAPEDAAPLVICNSGSSRCVDLATEERCNEAGTGWDLTPCGDAAVCAQDACQPTICEPEATLCQGASRYVCDSAGTTQLPYPCQNGYGCLDGACVRVKPNVALVVDTSGSMAFPADPADFCQVLPCDGIGFPACEDEEAPMSRLAHAKLALQALFETSVVTGARVSLQRFPSTGSGSVDCSSGYTESLFVMTGDSGAHEVQQSWFDKAMDEVVCVPFDPITGDTNVAALSEWVDFEESVTPSGQNCGWDPDCPSNICAGGKCQALIDPELRAVGGTPLGRSLFYASEYLRLHMLIQHKPCDSDDDCRTSPDHRCVPNPDGPDPKHCIDPLAHCRENVIILVTDGEETAAPDKNDFFHPWVQAKRLRYGLGCTADIQCAGGATCDAGICEPPLIDAPEGRCMASLDVCTGNADCPDFFCGLDAPCPGTCVLPDLAFTDGLGKNHVKGYDKLPLTFRVHVVDASGRSVDNAIIADWGGGESVALVFTDVTGLYEALKNLVDLKQGALCE